MGLPISLLWLSPGVPSLYLSPMCSLRARIYFLMGASVTTLFQPPSLSYMGSWVSPVLTLYISVWSTFLFTSLFISLSQIMDSSKSGIISYLVRSKNLSSQESSSRERINWGKMPW